MIPLSVGLFVMLVGISLMIWHWTQWSDVNRSVQNPQELRYAANQFRRRVFIGSLMAITGSVLASLNWASDPRVFTGSILLLFLLLLCILVLAVIDMMNVLVHFRLGPPANEARKRLIQEYHKRQQQKADDNPKSDSNA